MTANISFRTKSLLEKWRTYLSNIKNILKKSNFIYHVLKTFYKATHTLQWRRNIYLPTTPELGGIKVITLTYWFKICCSVVIIEDHQHNAHLSLRTPYIWTSILFRDMLWVEPINWFNPALFVYLSQARTCISNIIIMLLSLFIFSELGWEVIVCFVDIGGILDHHCLNFIFTI
jgi:hypothetical protein